MWRSRRPRRSRRTGCSVEVVDLRSLRPLDEETIVAVGRKTHRCVVVHEGWPYGGVGAEISDRVQRLAFDALDAPILRVTTLDVPMPYNAKLEQFCLPQADRIVRAVKRVSRPAPERRARKETMAKILDMPKLSPTMEEGVLSAWHKNEGDAVVVDDLLADVETDKATMEFRAFDKGTLLKLLVPAGATVKLGQPVAILGDAGEDISRARLSAAQPPSEAEAPRRAAADRPPPRAPVGRGHANEARTSRRSPRSAPPTMPEAELAHAPQPLRRCSIGAPSCTRRHVAARPERSRQRTATGCLPRRTSGRRRARWGSTCRGAHGSGPGGRVVATDLDGLAPRARPPRRRARAPRRRTRRRPRGRARRRRRSRSRSRTSTRCR